MVLSETGGGLINTSWPCCSTRHEKNTCLPLSPKKSVGRREQADMFLIFSARLFASALGTSGIAQTRCSPAASSLLPPLSRLSPSFQPGRVWFKIDNRESWTTGRRALSPQPGEERRTHQWSFKPSAATVLSHAAVFLPAGSRYVGVQQGSTLVSWRESEQDVKRPLSCQVITSSFRGTFNSGRGTTEGARTPSRSSWRGWCSWWDHNEQS